jgi:hypothetical protein
VTETAAAGAAVADRPRLDLNRLNFALEVVKAQRRITAMTVAAETGIPGPSLSKMRTHGVSLSADNLLALLAWLNMPASQFMLADPPADRAAQPAAA